MSNILEQANNIINNRSQEKERQYGPMGEGFERAALIASGMSGKEWTAHDMFIAMVALKFSRQSYNFKEDNLLDAVAYIGAWQNYINDTKPDHAGPDAPETIAPHENKKELLTEANKDGSTSKEKDTPVASSTVAQNPYSSPISDPRAIIDAISKLGEVQ